jgi:hypothetical protein
LNKKSNALRGKDDRGVLTQGEFDVLGKVVRKIAVVNGTPWVEEKPEQRPEGWYKKTLEQFTPNEKRAIGFLVLIRRHIRGAKKFDWQAWSKETGKPIPKHVNA